MPRKTVTCPHSRCDARIPVDTRDKPGVYLCLCHAIRMRLSWDGDRPVLRQI